MFLYLLTLQKATAITQAVHGNFSGTKQQEIAVGRGKTIDLYRIDPTTGKLHSMLSVDFFALVRSLTPFRLTGSNKDFLMVGSDSGRVVILEYNPTKNELEKVHQETFGKSGCRRIVPGQYIAADPKGRAAMIAAVEKQKLVYILNRDASARLTISSPLEAHKSHTIVFNIVGVDVGFENPMFATLELDYEEADNDPTGEVAQVAQQMLTFYELDLGLNHVVRKYSEPLEDTANFLIAVPGGSDGPSGVLVCCENYLLYKNFGDQPDIRCPIPRRKNDLDDAERSMLFVCSATHRTKHMYFFLIQTEQGDIFKVTLETEDEMVNEIRIKYFDTVPVATSMGVLKTGFLFCASEYGNHLLYQIAHLGDDDEEPEFSSKMPLEEGETFFFAPRPLKNLVLVDELESLSPIMASQIADLAGEDTPQLYLACGRGPRSSLRVLRHGLEVTEMAVSELPGNPNAVWTVKTSSSEEFDSYIVVSFTNATLVLSIGDTVEEVTDSGFLGTTPTLACSILGEDALVQVYPEGIRHIRADKRVNEWRTPAKRYITKCAINDRQVVISLTGGEIVYFEMDSSGQLNEYTERKEMSADVVCMSLGSVPPGEQRCRFLAVGLADQTVRIVSLDPSDTLQPLSMQALPAPPESLCIVEMSGSGEDAVNTAKGLFLSIGLLNGVLLRTSLDAITGDLSDTRTRYLGTRPVKLFRVKMQSSESVLAVSSRSWLAYMYQSRYHLAPLSYDVLEHASGFSSEQCPEGIVAIAANTLRILSLEKLGVIFNQVATPLQFTPRKLVVHPPTGTLVIAESDHRAFTETSKMQRKQLMAEEMVQAASEQEQEEAARAAEAFLKEELPETVFGAPKAGPGMWASCLRLMHPTQGRTLDLVQFDQNEAAFSIAVCQFAARGDMEWYVVVGTARDLTLTPRTCSGGSLILFRMTPDGTKLEHVHTTQTDEAPTAMEPFQGRLLVGMGRLLRLYDVGKKKMLRKCENKHIPTLIVDIRSMGNRVYVSDVQEGVHFVRYKATENQLIIFADETLPRWSTALAILDYNTIASADKFGNIAIVRLPSDVTDEVDEDPSGSKAIWERGLLSGASQKAQLISHVYIGETIHSLHRAALIPGGSELIVFTTLSGAIGMLLPFTSKEDIDFFQHLEMHMRAELPSLVGRDHLSFRSYYVPAKGVIDGDLCELYNSLDSSKKKTIVDDLDRTPNEVSKKLEDMRTRYAF